MITTTMASTSLLADVIESDALYFELGARTKEVEAARIAWMEDFADVPAGCVVQRVLAAHIRSPYHRWVESIEAQLREAGARWSRIYLAEAPPAGLERALVAAGYCRRVEFAFVSEGVEPEPPPGDVRIRAVRTLDDWRSKAGLHQRNDQGSDGYYHDPARWVSLIQEKVRAGGKQSYLVEKNGHAAAEVAIMESANILRLKNLYVAPESRGNSLGVAAVAFVQHEALGRGKQAMGVFGVEGSPGARTYRKCGLKVVGQQVEWSRRL